MIATANGKCEFAVRWGSLKALYAVRSDDASPGEEVSTRMLSDAETMELELFSSPQRRADWLAGRRLAKKLLDQISGIEGGNWEVLSRISREKGLPPRVFHCGFTSPWIISLAHSEHIVATAASEVSGEFVGVDVVEEQSIPAGFGRLWFDDDEKRRIESAKLTLLDGWAIKEAAFKSLRVTTAFEPRQIKIGEPVSTGILVHAAGGRAIISRSLRHEKAIIAFARSRPTDDNSQLSINN